jgi:hypothetical protein
VALIHSDLVEMAAETGHSQEEDVVAEKDLDILEVLV